MDISPWPDHGIRALTLQRAHPIVIYFVYACKVLFLTCGSMIVNMCTAYSVCLLAKIYILFSWSEVARTVVDRALTRNLLTTLSHGALINSSGGRTSKQIVGMVHRFFKLRHGKSWHTSVVFKWTNRTVLSRTLSTTGAYAAYIVSESYL